MKRFRVPATNFTIPTTKGWLPSDLIQEVESFTRSEGGRWRLRFGRAWSPYLDADYDPSPRPPTLKERLLTAAGVASVETDDGEDAPTFDIDAEEE